MGILRSFFSTHKTTIFVLLFLFLYSVTITYAIPPTSPYLPGESLDPSCAPGDTACSVSVIPDQTGNSGEFLTTDGSTTSWSTVAGNISSLTNDSGYITSSSSDNLTNKTGNISQWTNDSSYLTADLTTASNGLTLTGNDTKLGGALTEATSITGLFPLTINLTDVGETAQITVGVNNGVGGIGLYTQGIQNSISIYSSNSSVDIFSGIGFSLDAPTAELSGGALSVSTSNSITTKAFTDARYWSLATGGTLSGTNTISAGTNTFTFSTTATTQNAFNITANSITSGTGLNVTSSAVMTSGKLLNLTANSATITTGLLTLNATGLTTGYAQNINVNGTTTLTTGGALNIVGPTGAANQSTGSLLKIVTSGAVTGTAGSGNSLQITSNTNTGTIASITGSAGMTTTGNLLTLTASAASTPTGLLTMTANGLTTGTMASITTSSSSINSTNGLLYVANSSSTTTGMLARFQSNSSTDSGLSILASGNIGMGIASPTVLLDIQGTSTTTSLGSERITNSNDSTFASNTGNWTGTGWTIGSGVATASAGAGDFSLSPYGGTSGSTYQISFTINTTTAGVLYAIFGGTYGVDVGRQVNNVTVVLNVVAGSSSSLVFSTDGSAWAGTLDNISIKEVTVPKVLQNFRNSSGTSILEIRSVDSSTAIGYAALRSNVTGSGTAIGRNAMASNISGFGNTAVGGSALANNTTGSSNTAVGDQALIKSTTGLYNTGLGAYSSLYRTSGDSNTTVGASSLLFSTAGSANTVVGTDAGTGGNYYNISNNTFVGYRSGYVVLTGASNNVLIGYQAADNLTTGAKNIVIGHDIDVMSATTSNQLNIGNIIFGTGVSGTGTTIAGSIGIFNNAPAVLFHVGSTSVTTGTTVTRFQNAGGTCNVVPSTAGGITCSSDMNLKKNITLLVDGSIWVLSENINNQNTILGKILALKPVQYNLLAEEDTNEKHTGFIAQEVEQIFPDLVLTDEEGKKSLSYVGLVPYTISAVQEMDLKIKNLSDLTTENTWRDALIGWFDNAENGIRGIFADRVETKQLCVGSACVTEQEFTEMIQNYRSQPAEVNNTPANDTEDSTDTDTNTNTEEPVIEEPTTETPVEETVVEDTPVETTLE